MIPASALVEADTTYDPGKIIQIYAPLCMHPTPPPRIAVPWERNRDRGGVQDGHLTDEARMGGGQTE